MDNAPQPSMGVNVIPSLDQHRNPWVAVTVTMGVMQVMFSVPGDQAEKWVDNFAQAVVAAAKTAKREASGLIVPASPGEANGKLVH